MNNPSAFGSSEHQDSRPKEAELDSISEETKRRIENMVREICESVPSVVVVMNLAFFRQQLREMIDGHPNQRGQIELLGDYSFSHWVKDPNAYAEFGSVAAQAYLHINHGRKLQTLIDYASVVNQPELVNFVQRKIDAEDSLKNRIQSIRDSLPAETLVDAAFLQQIYRMIEDPFCDPKQLEQLGDCALCHWIDSPNERKEFAAAAMSAFAHVDRHEKIKLLVDYGRSSHAARY